MASSDTMIWDCLFLGRIVSHGWCLIPSVTLGSTQAIDLISLVAWIRWSQLNVRTGLEWFTKSPSPFLRPHEVLETHGSTNWILLSGGISSVQIHVCSVHKTYGTRNLALSILFLLLGFFQSRCWKFHSPLFKIFALFSCAMNRKRSQQSSSETKFHTR